MTRPHVLHLSERLSISLEAVTQTFAVLGMRGSGKTHLASVLAEELLAAGQPLVAIDPTGAWWGLRSSANGREPGYPVVVFGGDHADVPLAESAGELIAQTIVERRCPAIVDTSGLKKAQARRFVAVFAETLYRLNREPLHVFFDEADEFAPQRVMGETARCCGAVETLIKRGRLRGLGCTVISQRPASINKDVLTQCLSLFAFRVSHPRDLAAIREWVSVHATDDEAGDVIRSLPTLKREGWFWSPAWAEQLVRFKARPRTTYDSSCTPRVGESRRAPKALATVDLAALNEEIARLAKEAEDSDPRTLRKRIADLERQLAETAHPAVQVERFEVPVLARETVDELRAVLRESIASLTEAVGEPLAALDRRLQAATVAGPLSAASATRRIPPGHDRRTLRTSPPPCRADGLSKAERLILRALYWLRGESVTPAKVAFYSGYSASSGGFRNALGSLRTAGLVEGWVITEAGAALAAPEAGERPAGIELREWLRPKLGKAENAILDALLDHPGQRLTQAKLADMAGYSETSGGFRNALGKLRTIEAAAGYERDGGVTAADVFFGG